MAKGIVIAATRSGSGKTLVTLGLIAALRARGLDVAPAKAGPDFIDGAILSRVAGREAVNLDPWAMRPQRLRALAGARADLLVVEGVMGLFDGAADGTGSTADLAATLGLPVVLVLDVDRMGQSVAPLAAGFARWRDAPLIAGIILNRVASPRHEQMLRRALAPVGLPILGAVGRQAGLVLPERHLGLVLPEEIARFGDIVAAAAQSARDDIDLDAFLACAREPRGDMAAGLPPLGQRVAIARDEAFAFLYPHWLNDWHAAGAELTFFSPLADEAPDTSADAIVLPGGYPELHGARLAAASGFKAGLAAARERGALIYGECGGFMVLGRSLTDQEGCVHAMTGLLPVETEMGGKPTLGYRRLTHEGHLPWPGALSGHEFHYSGMRPAPVSALFAATDALGRPQPPLGAVAGRVMGSYAHVIDVA